jgi:high-affinity nickel permease
VPSRTARSANSRGRRFGYFFSLGHSTIVIAMGVGIIIAEKVVLLVHMIEEYARHNGHADLLRERIDGGVGR